MGRASPWRLKTVRRISIHPSRVGWDRSLRMRKDAIRKFQSTHPVWDGTSSKDTPAFKFCISIHPSRVGWDAASSHCGVGNALFQSTHPVWDGTLRSYQPYWCLPYFNPPIPCGMGPCNPVETIGDFRISIHPSRVGWDAFRGGSVTFTPYFNPPIPCGMGRSTWTRLSRSLRFQSTHPVWDGTVHTKFYIHYHEFQSTHPVWDGTAKNI